MKSSWIKASHACGISIKYRPVSTAVAKSYTKKLPSHGCEVIIGDGLFLVNWGGQFEFHDRK